MGLGDKLKNFICEDDNEEELAKEEPQNVSPYETKDSVVLDNANIVLFEPRDFKEAPEIGEHVKNRRACCINLRSMPKEYRQRTIDFLSGVIYGVDGTIKKIDDNVVLCSPKNLQVGGDINLNSRQED